MPFKSTKFLKSSRVKLSFTNKAMTAYGGFSIIAKLLENFEFREHVEAMFPFEETSPNSTGIYSKVLRFGLTVLVGGRRFSHSMFLGDSLEIYEAVFSVKRMTKSISSVTRFFNRIHSFQAAEYLSERLWRYTMDSVIPWHKIKGDYLSLDSTVVTRYGEQEGARVGYNPKKRGRPSHHPLLAFLNRNQFVVNLWNRPGNTSSFNNCLEFAKQTWERLEGKLKIWGGYAIAAFTIKLLLSLSRRKWSLIRSPLYFPKSYNIKLHSSPNGPKLIKISRFQNSDLSMINGTGSDAMSSSDKESLR